MPKRTTRRRRGDPWLCAGVCAPSPAVLAALLARMTRGSGLAATGAARGLDARQRCPEGLARLLLGPPSEAREAAQQAVGGLSLREWALRDPGGPWLRAGPEGFRLRDAAVNPLPARTGPPRELVRVARGELERAIRHRAEERDAGDGAARRLEDRALGLAFLALHEAAPEAIVNLGARGPRIDARAVGYGVRELLRPPRRRARSCAACGSTRRNACPSCAERDAKGGARVLYVPDSPDVVTRGDGALEALADHEAGAADAAALRTVIGRRSAMPTRRNARALRAVREELLALLLRDVTPAQVAARVKVARYSVERALTAEVEALREDLRHAVA